MFIEQLINKCWKTYLNIKTKKGDVIISNIFTVIRIIEQNMHLELTFSHFAEKEKFK